ERSILARADAGDFFRCGSDRADLVGVTPPQPGGQFPANAGAKLQRVLPHHLLRLHGALCCQHLVAWLASVPVWLRCAERGVGNVAGRVLCRRRNACRGLPTWSGTDARWMIAAGLLIMAAGNYWMSQLNLEISPGQVVWPRVVLVLGLSICFAPANVAAYLYTP